MTAVDTELIQRIEEQVAQAYRVRNDQVRAALNEAGIRRARGVLADAPDILANALGNLRDAQDRERRAREALDAATVAAEWDLDSRFVVEGNKTWLVDHDDGSRRAMTADERKTWKQAEVRKQPEVATAAAALRAAEQEVAARRDDVTLAEKRLGVARADLEAAVAELNALALTLKEQTR